MDKISVIIPVYKVEKYLHKCIESVISQTYENLEIILVDDGSPDNCGNICDSYAEKDSRIRSFHKANGGLSSARNFGIEKATGEYIAFLDSDDYLEKDTYEKLYTALINGDAEIAICNLRPVDENGEEVNLPFGSLSDDVLSKYDALTNLSHYVALATAHNKLYKKALFKEICFPIGRLHEDEFIAHVIFHLCTKVATVSDFLYNYLQRSDSIMASFNINRLDSVDALYERYLFLQKNYDLNLALPALFSAYANLIKAYSYSEKKTRKSHKKRFNKIHKLILKELLKNKLYKKALKQILFKYTLTRNLFESLLLWKFRLAFSVRHKKKTSCIMIATPTHGNLGDQAIVYAEKKLLEKKYKVIEINNEDYLRNNSWLEKKIRKSDIIIIDGGGNLGTLWKNEDDKISDIISRFRENKIIVFPETCYYDGKFSSRQRLEKNRKIYNSAHDLTVLLRDESSYDFFQKNFPKVKAKLMPDIVLSLKNVQEKHERKGVLLCFRSDKEKALSLDEQSILKKHLEIKNIKYSATGTIVNKYINKNNRTDELNLKWDEFSKASLIITDRLHAMIFAAITETPCIALDNISGKVKGTYDLLRELDYIKISDNIDIAISHIDEMQNIKANYNYIYPEEEILRLL